MSDKNLFYNRELSWLELCSVSISTIPRSDSFAYPVAIFSFSAFFLGACVRHIRHLTLCWLPAWNVPLPRQDTI